MRTMLMAAAILVLASASPAVAQAAEAPAFVVGDNTLYAHATEDSLSVWMNALVQDGFGPYQLTGESAFTDPVLGLGIDPVADEDFEARIALTPGLGQALVLDGTITVQAYIGGGTYTAGAASIATSLAVDGVVVASAPAKDHVMTGEAQPGPYDAISWTMAIEAIAVPEGALLEWVLSGTIDVGNNIFLASNEARGRSHIILPVAEIVTPIVDEEPIGGNETTNETADGNMTDDGNETTEPVDDPDAGNETKAPADCPDSAGCEAQADENETIEDTPAPKESPGVALPMVLAILGAVAVVRLRRS